MLFTMEKVTPPREGEERPVMGTVQYDIWELLL